MSTLNFKLNSYSFFLNNVSNTIYIYIYLASSVLNVKIKFFVKVFSEIWNKFLYFNFIYSFIYNYLTFLPSSLTEETLRNNILAIQSEENKVCLITNWAKLLLIITNPSLLSPWDGYFESCKWRWNYLLTLLINLPCIGKRW